MGLKDEVVLSVENVRIKINYIAPKHLMLHDVQNDDQDIERQTWRSRSFKRYNTNQMNNKSKHYSDKTSEISKILLYKLVIFYSFSRSKFKINQSVDQLFITQKIWIKLNKRTL